MYAVLTIHLVSLDLVKVMKLLKFCMNIRTVLKLRYSELSCSWLTVQLLHIFKVIISITKEGIARRIKIDVGVCRWGEQNS